MDVSFGLSVGVLVLCGIAAGVTGRLRAARAAGRLDPRVRRQAPRRSLSGLHNGSVLKAVASVRSPFRVFAAGTAGAVYLLQFPMVLEGLAAGLWSWLKAAFATMLVTLQVFCARVDIGVALEMFGRADNTLTRVESLYAVILFALAPTFTIGFVLTYFQEISAHLHYLMHLRREVNIFSDLNERSLALACSLRSQDPGTVLVFTNVILATNDPSVELVGAARALGAICFKGDIQQLPLHRHGKSATMRFFVIGGDSDKDLLHATAILGDPSYANRRNAHLYLFSDSTESDLVLSQCVGEIRARRINPARALIYDWLWRDPDATPGGKPAGIDTLLGAADGDGGAGDPVVSIGIVGLGGYGSEMLRALAWYCQMDTPAGGAYQVRIRGFDKDAAVVERLAGECSELIGRRNGIAAAHNQGVRRQDAVSDIELSGAVDAATPDLARRLLRIDPLTFVFISLGNDAANLDVAVTLCRAFARAGRSAPRMLAVSRNSKLMRRALAPIAATARPGTLPISFIGDDAELYDQATVIRSDMELNGLVAHMYWGGWDRFAAGGPQLENPEKWRCEEDRFWSEEYYYSSSITVPIHWKARRALGLPGTGNEPRTSEQRDALKRLEHARWCQFMRGQGFIHSSADDRQVAKTHRLLRPFDELDPGDREKDENDSRNVLACLLAEEGYQRETAGGPYHDFVARLGGAVERATVVPVPGDQAWSRAME